MKNKWIIKGLCAFAVAAVAISSGAALLNNSRKAKPVNTDTGSTAANGITDISSYHKKIKLDMDANLPPAEILNLGGNGLQLYDTQGNFINGDIPLDCTNELTCFLRVVWLENYASDCSLIVLADNHVQMFRVDDKREKSALLDVKMQPKSSLNIPISVSATGDASVSNSKLTFLFLSYDIKKSESGKGDAFRYPNSTNSLCYKINTGMKKDYSDNTAAASNFIKQNSKNGDFIKSKAFYSVLSPKSDENFMFYEEKPTLNISKNDYSFYAMGQSKGLSFLFIGDKLVNAFDNKPYLSYTLNENSYLKQKVNLNLVSITEGDRLMIINIQQSTPLYYTVTCHNLSLTQ